MNPAALFQLSYGLYILTAREGEKRGGCVVNTLSQVTSDPQRLSVAVNKDNYTCGMIQRSGRFSATVLTQEAPMELIRAFGFQSSKDVDKFLGFEAAQDGAGVDYVAQYAAARFSCAVEQTLDLGSHMLFIGRLEEAEVLDDAHEVMTYSYYHQVKKGSTPKNAPSYQAKTEKKVFRCTICGYIAEMDELPEDFICPVCGASATAFEPIG